MKNIEIKKSPALKPEVNIFTGTQLWNACTYYGQENFLSDDPWRAAGYRMAWQLWDKMCRKYHTRRSTLPRM